MQAAFRIITIWIVCVWSGAALAAPDRVALVLGMGAYQTIEPLDNTRNDARAIAETLEGIGFDVTLSMDATADQLRQQMDDFAFRSETADLALIYFAGHGVEVQGENFLIPVDARIRSNRDIQRQSISLKQMLKTVEHARKMRIVILDSCRDNPLGDNIDLTKALETDLQPTSEATRGGGGGLAPANPERGTLVAFAAKDGQVALDGTGENSPYAQALIQKMAKPGLEISLMFRQVRDKVLQDTNNLQEPHTYGSLTGVPFYLAGAEDGQPDISGSVGQAAWAAIKPDQEEQMLALAELGDTRSMLGLAYMRLNPKQGRFDPEQAVAFLEKASAAGSAEAQFELAKVYERGTGVPVNEARALELYQTAADQDFADAINDLGFLHYQGGLGLPADPEKALTYFERAADLRHPQALFNFAALIDDGLIDSKGPADSAEYLYAALRSGSSDVLDLLSTRPKMFSPQTRRALQSILKKWDFYSGAIDGEFGPNTIKSIRRAYGLKE